MSLPLTGIPRVGPWNLTRNFEIIRRTEAINGARVELCVRDPRRWMAVFYNAGPVACDIGVSDNPGSTKVIAFLDVDEHRLFHWDQYGPLLGDVWYIENAAGIAAVNFWEAKFTPSL